MGWVLPFLGRAGFLGVRRTSEENSWEGAEVKSAFTYLSGCNPRGKTVEVGLRGGKTEPKIVMVLTGWAASHVHGRAARTCQWLSGGRQALRTLVDRGPHLGSLGFHSLLAPRPSSPYSTPPARSRSAWNSPGCARNMGPHPIWPLLSFGTALSMSPWVAPWPRQPGLSLPQRDEAHSCHRYLLNAGLETAGKPRLSFPKIKVIDLP